MSQELPPGVNCTVLEHSSQFAYTFINILEFEPPFRFKLRDIATTVTI